LKFYLLFILIPIIVFSIIRDKTRRQQSARRAQETTASVDQVMREINQAAKEISKATVASEKPLPRTSKPAPVHTEGMHPVEIQETKEKLIAREYRDAEIEATRREIREMDLKKLRSAVIMSEILDRPVSLRSRSYPK